MKKTQPQKKPGRPSDYSDRMASIILGRLVEGESLRAICRDENMPAASTVFLWLQKNPQFSERYAHAREVQAEGLFDEILDISDDARNDWMRKHGNGDEGDPYILNGEHVQRSRLRVDARKWMLSKMLPKKYGDSLNVDHGGNISITIAKDDAAL